MPDNLKDALKKLAEAFPDKWHWYKSGIMVNTESGKPFIPDLVSSDDADELASELGYVMSVLVLTFSRENGFRWVAQISNLQGEYRGEGEVCATKLLATRAGLCKAISLYLEKEKP